MVGFPARSGSHLAAETNYQLTTTLTMCFAPGVRYTLDGGIYGRS